MHKPRTMGNSIAPWRFVLFFIILVIACLAGLFGATDPWLGLLVGFDIAAAIFLLSCVSILKICDPEVIERAAERNDANRTELLMLTGIVMGALLIAIAAVTANVAPRTGDQDRRHPDPVAGLAVQQHGLCAPLCAHGLYAARRRQRRTVFANTKDPVYWDFVYFAFTIGMTFQTSDVSITSDAIRRVVTVHSFAAFIFNIGVLAFTINVLGGSS